MAHVTHSLLADQTGVACGRDNPFYRLLIVRPRFESDIRYNESRFTIRREVVLGDHRY